jgi:MFS family permease
MLNDEIKIEEPLIKNRSFILFWFARTATGIAWQMLAVAVGWQMYEITGSVFFLGMVGLAQFLPMFFLTLVVGHVVDRFNRRLILCTAMFIQTAGVSMLIAEASAAGLTGKACS